MHCPNCGAPMSEQTFEGQLGTHVTIDLCLSCQAFWFDGYESLKLTPASVLKLFRLIGEQPASKPVALSDRSACPRCQMRLVPTHDLQRSTKFEYLRCPAGHGRLTSFYNFLREKDFIRPLTSEQIAELRRNVQTVNCANCGASIDLAAGTTCAHCGSPLSMLDMKQAKALIDTLKAADAAKSIDPAWPLRAEMAKRQAESSFASIDQWGDQLGDQWGDGSPGWIQQVKSASLVTAGIAAVAAWLKGRQ